MKVHIFIGYFNTREEATRYSEPYWEPEPEETVSDEEYTLWENSNPKWKMATDLNCLLDSDFIETITDNKFEYLSHIIKEPKYIETLKYELNSKNSTLILIFDNAISKNKKLYSTNVVKYFGCFKSLI